MGHKPESDAIIEYLISTKVSSIEMISRDIDLSIESTCALFEELVAADIIHGCFSDDGTRFFKSDVKVSAAPSVGKNEDLMIQKKDTSIGKYTSISGIVAIIIGQILSQLNWLLGEFIQVGAILVLLGMGFFVGGLIYISKKDPPGKV